MRGSLWNCSQLQCKLATTEESRGLEIQNQLLDDMKAEFQEFQGRRVYTDVEREGIPPSDGDRPPAAPRAIQEEEDRTSASIPTLPPVTCPPPSLPELDSESHCSFREALQGENVLVPSDISSHLDSDRSHRTTSQISRNRVGPCRQMSCHVRWSGGTCAKCASARVCPPNEPSGTECAKVTF